MRVLDLAAGSGVWGIAIAQGSKEVRVTAVDWPEVIPITRKTVAGFGLADRFSFIAGDLLEADFGTDHTVATLGHILHSEGMERSRALIAKTFHALAPGGTIAIAEFLVNADRTGPLNALFFAVNMLVNTDSGDTYSFEEIRKMVRGCRIRECPHPRSTGPITTGIGDQAINFKEDPYVSWTCYDCCTGCGYRLRHAVLAASAFSGEGGDCFHPRRPHHRALLRDACTGVLST